MWVAAVMIIASSIYYVGSLNNRERITALENTVEALSKQMMVQQLYVEEKTRSEGNSGLKQIRHKTDGTRRYYSETHTYNSIAAIHDHANTDRTVGMGELIAVLNGVEFRTRHNDYKLYMPSTTSNTYHETEPIPFPDVPQSVLDKATVEEQIAEMQEYFRGWGSQNASHRNYLPYFRPVLSYMEGGWTTETQDIDEPFNSDHHYIAANDWFHSHTQIRFTSATGLKDNEENFAFLPTAIANVTDRVPRFAQWNYRIMCHSLNRTQVKLNRFKVADDLSLRVSGVQTLEELAMKRSARFRISRTNEPYEEESRGNLAFLDSLMYEIPGKNNYNSPLTETAFDVLAYKLWPADTILDASKYHRVFKYDKKGAMGLKKRHMGFKDETLYVAKTTQPQIVPFSVYSCRDENGQVVCKTFESRDTYAIPMEIIFLTPLLTWNPYNIDYKTGALRATVTADGRNGGLDNATAYDGIRDNLYYKTPADFFEGDEIDVDPADTVKEIVGVLDRDGNVQSVVASGTRIFLPSIPGIGALRTRYPIMPIYGEATSVWKEFNALKEIVLQQQTYNNLLHEQ